ncbi:uncharacterized protein LAJ45_04674 [Morchella importuna]|uniref:uncharacterized protein n=1 Tax=Morchella importuna TaxID=1174673 RepID=UPI001E8D5D90|nr:uncharacterized protein LAJ45_04674 [Morchella importuna]KAH8151469.1 hypothetical protein LAJ45_04674 [Morchella importuna]
MGEACKSSIRSPPEPCPKEGCILTTTPRLCSPVSTSSAVRSALAACGLRRVIASDCALPVPGASALQWLGFTVLD